MLLLIGSMTLGIAGNTGISFGMAACVVAVLFAMIALFFRLTDPEVSWGELGLFRKPKSTLQ